MKISKQKLFWRRSQTGMALVMVMMMGTILLLILTTGITWTLNAQKDTSETFKIQGQAANVAQAGLQDAVNWFKRQGLVYQTDQTTYPCKDSPFNPAFNADAALSATDDASVGMVKDFQVKGNIYGRYILRKQPCGSAQDENNVRDITAFKGKATAATPPTWVGDGTLRGEGVVWSLKSEGILYYRNNFAKTGNVFTVGPSASPNRVLSKALAGVEISRLGLQLATGPLTVFTTTTPNHALNSRCRINLGTNGTVGVTYNGQNPDTTTATFQMPGGATKEGTTGPVSANSVFSVSELELKGMADNVYTTLTEVPEELKFSITYLEGDFNFTSAKPLFGGGLLYVNGNLNLANGANSLFSGVIFVDGDLTMGRDNSLAGSVVARRLYCTPGSGQATFEYNSNLVTSVRQRLALYRENNLTRISREF